MSTRIPEGEKVAFVGEPNAALDIDDRGIVLQAAGEGSHVRWDSGLSQGQITLVSNLDLVSVRGLPRGDDALDAPLLTISVRAVLDQQGPTGLLNVLNQEGHLAFFEPLARDAVDMIQSNIRNEAQQLISLATSTLLRDAFGRE